MVVDTNIFVAALLRDSGTRALLIHPLLNGLFPDHGHREAIRLLPELVKRMAAPPATVRSLFDALLGCLRRQEEASYVDELHRAHATLARTDPDDAPFLALALARSCPLWTADRALLDAPEVPTITTGEVAAILGGA